jgi:hypothetical protein
MKLSPHPNDIRVRLVDMSVTWLSDRRPVSNVFDSLCDRLVLDVLSGKDSRDYAVDIKVDKDFETVVHELRAFFGFCKFAHTCESILHFYSL